MSDSRKLRICLYLIGLSSFLTYYFSVGLSGINTGFSLGEDFIGFNIGSINIFYLLPSIPIVIGLLSEFIGHHNEKIENEIMDDQNSDV